jgi:hypothetical protein
MNENQKKVTKDYLNNWDTIFKKKGTVNGNQENKEEPRNGGNLSNQRTISGTGDEDRSGDKGLYRPLS